MAFDSVELKAFPGARMRFALLSSCLLHGVLLWSPRPPVLRHDGAAVVTAQMKRAPTPPAPEKATRSPRPPPAAVAVPPLAVASASTFQAPPPVPEVRAVRPAPVALPMPVAPVTVSLPETDSPGISAEDLRGYRLALAIQARRFKRYPPKALASGWAGSVEIRLELDGTGRPRPAQVTQSSGRELLDHAARAMIDAGAAHASLPESLRGKAFAVVLPVLFSLDETAGD